MRDLENLVILERECAWTFSEQDLFGSPTGQRFPLVSYALDNHIRVVILNL